MSKVDVESLAKKLMVLGHIGAAGTAGTASGLGVGLVRSKPEDKTTNQHLYDSATVGAGVGTGATIGKLIGKALARKIFKSPVAGEIAEGIGSYGGIATGAATGYMTGKNITDNRQDRRRKKKEQSEFEIDEGSDMSEKEAGSIGRQLRAKIYGDHDEYTLSPGKVKHDTGETTHHLFRKNKYVDGKRVTGYDNEGNKTDLKTNKSEKEAILGTLIGTGIGAGVGAIRDTDEGESRAKSVLRSMLTGTATGLGADVGSTVGGVAGGVTGSLPGLAMRNKDVQHLGGAAGSTAGSVLGALAGGAGAHQLAKRKEESEDETEPSGVVQKTATPTTIMACVDGYRFKEAARFDADAYLRAGTLGGVGGGLIGGFNPDEDESKFEATGMGALRGTGTLLGAEAAKQLYDKPGVMGEAVVPLAGAALAYQLLKKRKREKQEQTPGAQVV